MYTGFNLKTDWVDENYYNEGQKIIALNKENVKKPLQTFATKNGIINGKNIQEHWFPQIEADVFISYSHDDEKKALSLAGFLKTEMDLDVFIDAAVWGYADELLRELDIANCYNKASGLFNYYARNRSTSHIHMMLATALSMMINRTECLFFINPDGISFQDSITHTPSPWIYYEIGMSALLKKEDKSAFRGNHRTKKFSMFESITIKYPLNTGHLQDITDADIQTWHENYKTVEKKHFSLDVLYQQFNNRQIINS